MLIFWFSQSPTDHCLPSYHPLPPLSLPLLSDWASSAGPKIVGDLLDLASCVGWWPQLCTWHQLLPVTDTVLWPPPPPVRRGGQGSMVFTHNYLPRGCGAPHLCTCYNILHILHTVWQTLFPWSPTTLIDNRPSDYQDCCQRSSSFTRGGGGGGWRKTVDDYFSLARSLLWCCDVYIYLTTTGSPETGWHLKWTSWVCQSPVISVILSYRQSDQIQTHTFIFQSCGGVEQQQPRFQIISTSGSLLASFFLASSLEIVSPGKFCVDDVVCHGYVSL